MELTEQTVEILKNFSTINPNLMFYEGDDQLPGSSLRTISEANNCLVKCGVPEVFPRSFGIYDLNEFMGTLGLVDTPNLDFEENNLIIRDQSGRSKIKYFYSDESNLTTPQKDISMPEPEVKFTLDSDTLNRLRKASSTLGHNELSITGEKGILNLSVLEKENNSSNTYTIDIDGEFDPDIDFNFVLNISEIKILTGDYDVGLSSRFIAQFDNKERETPYELSYWIALNKNLSTFGGKK